MATMPVINDSQLAVDPKYYTSITDTSTVEAPLFPTAVVMTASWSPSAIPSSPSNARTRGGLSGQGIVIVSAILTITTLIAALFLWSLWKRRQVMRRERAAVNFLIVLASKRTHGTCETARSLRITSSAMARTDSPSSDDVSTVVALRRDAEKESRDEHGRRRGEGPGCIAAPSLPARARVGSARAPSYRERIWALIGSAGIRGGSTTTLEEGGGPPPAYEPHELPAYGATP